MVVLDHIARSHHRRGRECRIYGRHRHLPFGWVWWP